MRAFLARAMMHVDPVVDARDRKLDGGFWPPRSERRFVAHIVDDAIMHLLAFPHSGHRIVRGRNRKPWMEIMAGQGLTFEERREAFGE